MSDVMLLGVLGMPLPDDPAELDLITWMQVKSRMLEAHERITSDADRIAALEAERDEWKKAATGRHPNPADFRYWEGRYRDEKDRADRLEAEVARLRAALNGD